MLFPLAIGSEWGGRFSKTFNKLLEWLESVTSFTKLPTLLGCRICLLVVNLPPSSLSIIRARRQAGIIVFFVLVSAGVLILSVVWMILLLYYSNLATKYPQIDIPASVCATVLSLVYVWYWPLSVAHLIISKCWVEWREGRVIYINMDQFWILCHFIQIWIIIEFIELWTGGYISMVYFIWVFEE